MHGTCIEEAKLCVLPPEYGYIPGCEVLRDVSVHFENNEPDLASVDIAAAPARSADSWGGKGCAHGTLI